MESHFEETLERIVLDHYQIPGLISDHTRFGSCDGALCDGDTVGMPTHPAGRNGQASWDQTGRVAARREKQTTALLRVPVVFCNGW